MISHDMEHTHPITVILPVYNTGKYLDRCLDSLLGQSFRDFTLLCIDDGSSDGSGSTLDARAAVDDRIRVVHLPENHGVPYARNLALDLAESEYIYFMDSDDWIDPDFLEAMYTQARETGQDVVINGNWYIEYDDPDQRKRAGRFDFVKEEASYYPPVVVQTRFFPVVWTRLYRLSYLREKGIKSPLLKGGVEDNYFTAMAEILQERSYIFNGPFYHYYQHDGSLARQPESAFRHFENFRVFVDELHKRNIPPQAARRFYVLDALEINTEEKFNFLHSFFEDVEADVRACPDLYSVADIFVMLMILACPDYESFRKRYSPKLSTSFMVRIIRNNGRPTKEQLLDGTWVV